MSKVGFQAFVLIADVVRTIFSRPKVPVTLVAGPVQLSTRFSRSLYVPAGIPAIAPVLTAVSKEFVVLITWKSDSRITSTLDSDVLYETYAGQTVSFANGW